MNECINCGADLGPLVDGDTVMCVECGQWHTFDVVSPGLALVETLTFSGAAARASAPMDPYECLDALESAARVMRPELIVERRYVR